MLNDGVVLGRAADVLGGEAIANDVAGMGGSGGGVDGLSGVESGF